MSRKALKKQTAARSHSITISPVWSYLLLIAVLLFFALTILAIFILRVKRPDIPRPYKAFGYPFIPALYILTTVIIMVILLIYKPNYTFPGLGIVLLGIPVFYLWKRFNGNLGSEQTN